ncbi:MAG TPA: hypothetical protein VFK11_04715 [Candidatus Saccharimonadales bacterium]|nr:hypothetical protein [Candidatus Saccharimonadales bacterium]
MKSTYSPATAKTLFANTNIDWWVAGGWALDLFLGRQTREHEDLDISVLRKDERKVRDFLSGWHMQIGLGEGKLEPAVLETTSIFPKDREIIWCKPSAIEDWAFEILLCKSEENEWVFKRDSKIRRPIKEIGGITDGGVPYLQPEIVLLFKAKTADSKNQADFINVLPSLSQKQRVWLDKSISMVHPGHPWLKKLR